ncbi:hypothetical protein L6452_40909 [Arctium lappa]|uniref:Uncharacterized protein n=1 Tax=Arctium lappa TaxID=4217 RepID=A0ACB8XMF7_ARCLA|nr:hypothetical protein L6452_40909 [Arctium lappa]
MLISCFRIFRAYIFDHMLMTCSTYEILGLAFLFKRVDADVDASDNTELLKFGRLLFEFYHGQERVSPCHLCK